MESDLESFLYQFDLKTSMRGEELYQMDSVVLLESFDNSYSFEVHGVHDIYSTYIELDDEGSVIECHCNCPHFRSGYFCKHLYASALYLQDILEDDEDDEDDDDDDDDDDYPYEDNSNVIEAEFKHSDIDLNDDIELDNSKSKLSKKIRSEFKAFATSYDNDVSKMTTFLKSNNFSYEELAELFIMIRTQSALQNFLAYLENNLDSNFFKNIKLDEFPVSFSFAYLAPFIIKHSNMLTYLSENSLNQLFIKRRVYNDQQRDTILFLALKNNLKYAIKGFFDEEDNYVTFLQDVYLIDYMRNNLSKDECINYMKKKIDDFNLTRHEVAFLYPYFPEATKSSYKSFFKNNNYCVKFPNYYSHNPWYYDSEYKYHLSMNSQFYALLTNNYKNDLTRYDLFTMFYLRHYLFTCEDKEIYGKRFKQLALAMFRTKQPDFKKIYCCIRILLEYGDKVSALKDVLYRVYDNRLSSLYACPEIYDLYHKLTLKYSLKPTVEVKEYK